MLREKERALRIAEMLDEQESEQLAADPDGHVDLDIPRSFEEFADWEVRASVRQQYGPQVTRARGDWFTDHAFHTSDRPGPPPSWLAEVATLDVADIEPTAPSAPGEVTVAAPPRSPRLKGAPSWELSTKRAWARSRVNFDAMRFGGPLALDVAIRGGAVSLVDVDNAAARMIRAFEAVFADTNADVCGVRVYRQDRLREDIQVRVLSLLRLLALADHVRDARRAIWTQRAERRRAAPVFPTA